MLDNLLIKGESLEHGQQHRMVHDRVSIWRRL